MSFQVASSEASSAEMFAENAAGLGAEVSDVSGLPVLVNACGAGDQQNDPPVQIETQTAREGARAGIFVGRLSFLNAGSSHKLNNGFCDKHLPDALLAGSELAGCPVAKSDVVPGEIDANSGRPAGSHFADILHPSFDADGLDADAR